MVSNKVLKIYMIRRLLAIFFYIFSNYNLRVYIYIFYLFYKTTNVIFLVFN